jgi:uncharacterized protein (TIGR02246 family)
VREPWQTVQAMNAAWVAQDDRGLADCYAEDAVLLPGAEEQRLRGRETCVRHGVEQRRGMDLEHFQAGTPKVEMHGDTAVVSYRFALTWRSGGARREARGLDVVVLSRRDHRWRVVWRTILPLAAGEGAAA